MEWKQLNPEEPETIYTSNADNCDDISNDLRIVVRRMIENLTANHANNPAKQLLYTKATNEAHIAICIMTESLIFDELDDAYEVYTQTELKGPERLYD